MTVVLESPVATRYSFNTTLGELLSAVKAVEPAVSRKPAVSILAGVLLTGDGAGVTVSAFDYTVAARYSVDGVGDGRVLLPFATLKALLMGAAKRGTKKVTDGWTVTIAHGGDGAVVTVNGAESRIGDMPLDEYPALPPTMDEPWVELDTPALLAAVATALVSVSKDTTLPVLTAVSMELDGGVLELFSTDRYRLTRATVPAKSAAAWKALVSGLTLKAWSRHLDKKAVTRVAVSGNGELLWLTNGAVSYSTLLVDGDYPKIRSLFPDSRDSEFVFDVATLAGAVASLAPMAVRNTPVRLVLTDRNCDLDVMIGGDGDHSHTAVPVLDSYGDECVLAFNPSYLLELLKNLKTGDMVVRVTSPNKPALFQPIVDGVVVDSVKHLLMPVRLPQQ